MITNTEDKSIDVDYDIFSLAGRAALIGGGIYAINKSNQEGVFKRIYNNDVLNPEKNKHIQGLKQIYSHEKTIMEKPAEQAIKFNKSPFSNILFKEPKNLKPINNFFEKDIVSKFSGGYKGYSKGLPDALEQLRSKIKGIEGENPTITVRYRSVDGKEVVDYVSMKTQVGHFRIHAVDSNGLVTTGTNAQNRYASRLFYDNVGGKLNDIYGSDVGMAMFLHENYERINAGEISLKEINETYQKALQFDDKNFKAAPVTSKTNRDLVNLTVNSAMPDPLINDLNNPEKILNPDNKKYVFRKPISVERQAIFNREQALAGSMIGSATDVNKGILYIKSDDLPFYKIPFLDMTNNPKQLTKDILYKDRNGLTDYQSDKNVIFLNSEAEKVFKDVLAERKIDLGEWGAEQLIVNKDKVGSIISTKRSLSIGGSELTANTDFLTKHMASIAGVTPDEFALKIHEKGFAAFDKPIQDKLKQVHIDEYQRYLEKELKASSQKRKSLLEANALYRVNKGGDDAYASAIIKEEEKIKTLREQAKQSKYLGRTSDGRGYEKIGREHKGLFIENIHYDERSKKLTYQLRNEKAIDIGDKFFDAAGEGKATVKASVSKLSDALFETAKRMGVQLDKTGMDRIRNVHALLPQSAMKTDTTARNAYSVFDGIGKEAALSGDKEVFNIIDNFHKNKHLMNENQKINVFHQLNNIAEKRGLNIGPNGLRDNKGLHRLSGKDIGLGFSSHKIFAFGDSAIDMGAGGLGFFAERHIKMFEAIGLSNFKNEIFSRRMNAGALATERSFNNSVKFLGDKAANKNVINIKKDISIKAFMENVFPSLPEEGVDLATKRRNFLSKFANENGTAFISLGEEIEGINKVAVFDTEHLMGYVGHQIGSSGEYKKYTELDHLTRNIINEVYYGKNKPEKLKTLIQNYKIALDQLGDNLKEAAFKGKVEKSLYGQITSGGKGMKEYADQLAESFKTENKLPFVAAVSDKKFIELFGEEEYKRFKKTKISNAWAMATREPVEGLSSVPLNIVPGSAFKDIEPLKDFQISVLANDDKSVLKMLFGDLDGDSLSLIPALRGKSIEEIKELAYGNGVNAKAFREHQEIKTKFSLKGKKQPSILEATLDEMRSATFHAKELEKGLVGIASNTFKPIHEANALRHGNLVNPNKYYQTENILHTLSENIIKGKHQNLQQLQSGKAKLLLDALNGRDELAGASLTDRMQHFGDALDEIFLGDNKHLAQRIRAGDRSADIVEAFKDNKTILDDDWFTKMTSKESIKDIFESLEVSTKTGSTASQVMQEEEIISGIMQKQKSFLKDYEGIAEDVKKISSGVGKNVFKYAVLPAAAFGLAGTILHSKSKITAEGETSDHSYKKPESPNMRNPKYMKPEVKGKAPERSSIESYRQQHSGGSMRIVDDTRTFDHQDMEDMIARGY